MPRAIVPALALTAAFVFAAVPAVAGDPPQLAQPAAGHSAPRLPFAKSSALATQAGQEALADGSRIVPWDSVPHPAQATAGSAAGGFPWDTTTFGIGLLAALTLLLRSLRRPQQARPAARRGRG
jgi:hypothetical protein